MTRHLNYEKKKKFSIKLIPVKSFMEGLVFLVAEIQIYYQSFPKSWRYNAEQV